MPIPLSPADVSVDQNMYLARASGMKRNMATPNTYYWFYQQVRNKGPWDYKQRDRKYAEFGNFNYGATGYAAGIPEEVLLRLAGCAQQRAGTSDLAWDRCWGKPPYGDDPGDQRWIQEGIRHAKTRGY
jgi:hypothetical protein